MGGCVGHVQARMDQWKQGLVRKRDIMYLSLEEVHGMRMLEYCSLLKAVRKILRR